MLIGAAAMIAKCQVLVESQKKTRALFLGVGITLKLDCLDNVTQIGGVVIILTLISSSTVRAAVTKVR